jgi:hypothetical protein
VRILSRNILAAAVFTGLAVLTTFPLVLDLDAVVPGTGAGDNVASLWNTWWFGQAMAGGASLFRTDLLFAPFGSQLSLHTHATTHSLLAWPWMAVTSVTSAHNLAILAGLALNGYVTFLLAYRLAGTVLPALIAGWLVATSAFVHVHLLGHMNLLHVWVIPAFALAVLRFASAPAAGPAVVVGAAGALVVYTDYYFAIYCGLMVLVWTLMRVVSVRFVPASAAMKTVSRLLFGVAGVAVAVTVAIVASGGLAMDLGPVRVSMRTARNPLNVAWLTFVIGAILRAPIRPSIVRDRALTLGIVAHGVLALLVSAVLLAPLLVALGDVITSGGYTSPRLLWRSSPPGGDLSTLLLGHPAHALTGGWTLRRYQQLGIDPIEGSLWLGVLTLLLLAAWRRSWLSDCAARPWLIVGIVFAILALGPFLRIGGLDTGLTLPQAGLRYVPGIANARMPGRAVVVVQLAVAMLLAIAWRRRQPGAAAATTIVGLLVLESLPGRLPLYRLPGTDAVDRILAEPGTSGPILELPTGLRDGFGDRGAFDHRALVHQFAHGRPVAGGFVARLSSRAIREYEEDPVLSHMIALSRGEAVPIPLAPQLAARGFTHLVINRDLLGGEGLSPDALAAAGYRFRTASGPRELFSIR